MRFTFAAKVSVGVILATVTIAAQVRADDATTRATVTEIVETLEARHTELNPILVTYHSRELRTPAAAIDDDRTSSAQLGDLLIESSSKLARKGRLVHMSHMGPAITNWTLRETDSPFYRIYDGTRTVKFSNQVGQGGKLRYRVARNPPPPRRSIHESLGKLLGGASQDVFAYVARW